MIQINSGYAKTALFAVAALGIFLRLSQPPVLFRGPDETVYAHYSRTIATQGQAGIKENIHTYNRDAELANFPTPIRLSYLTPLAGLMKLLKDGLGDKSGTLLSLLFSLASIAVLAWGGLYFFGFLPAFFGLLFLAVSPLEIMLSRRILQDGIFSCLAGLVIFQACHILRRPEKRAPYFLLAALGTFILFFKESGVVVYGLTFALTSYLLAKSPKNLTYLFFSAFIFFLPALFIFIYLCGGTGPLVETLQRNHGAASSNILAFFQNGAWYSFLQMQWLLSPASMIMFFVGAFSIIYRVASKQIVDDERKAALVLLGFTTLFFIAACIPPNYKNARLLSPIHLPYCLIAGLGSAEVVRMLRQRLNNFLRIPAVLLFATLVNFFLWVDYDNYHKIFVEAEMIEMISLPRLKDLSLYQPTNPQFSAQARFAKTLIEKIPNDTKTAISESFINAMRHTSRPYVRLYQSVCESGWILSANHPMPAGLPPTALPSDVKYLLYDALDFYFILRPELQNCAPSFFSSRQWEPVDFGANKVLFKKGSSGMGALYQVNPPSDEPTTLLQASAGDIELHGVWVALSQKGKHLTKINLSIDWRCLKNNLPDYSMTIWAIDKKGALIFEEKRLICYGLRPTSSWKAGERVIENYRLILPDNMPPQFEIRSGVCLLQDEKLKPFHPSEKIDRNGLAVIGIFEPSIS